MSEGTKRCQSRCGRVLPNTADHFPERTPGGLLRNSCRDCENFRRAEQKRRAKERAASDYTPLEPEDFAVGVGNIPETPIQAAMRSKASAEKRQEYNRLMGETLGAVRDVAAGESSDLGPEVTEYLGILSEQERRWGNRRLARSTAISLAHELLGIRWFKKAAEEFFSSKVVPTGYSARKKPLPEPGTLDRTLCLGLSDLHIGADLSGIDNPQPFRRLEESRRLAHLGKEVLDYKPRHRDRTRLKILLNGDIINGMLMHELRDGAPLTEQMVVFWHLFRQLIALLAAHFILVEVEMQPGNHGRDKLRHPGRATSSKWDGHEWRMYYALSMMFSDIPNVKFNLPYQAVSLIDLYGKIMGMSHGDTEIKLGNPNTKHTENLAQLQKVNTTRLHGVEIAAWFFGHYHSPFLAPGYPTIVYNGMLVPPDGYARSMGYIDQPCGQWIWEAVPGFPVGDARFVNVGPEQDNDESLDSILTPPKFGD